MKRRLFDEGNRPAEIKPWRWQLSCAYARALLHSAHAQSNELGWHTLSVLIKSLLKSPFWKGLSPLLNMPMQRGWDNSAGTMR
jgi:hypothetical protein